MSDAGPSRARSETAESSYREHRYPKHSRSIARERRDDRSEDEEERRQRRRRRREREERADRNINEDEGVGLVRDSRWRRDRSESVSADEEERERRRERRRRKERDREAARARDKETDSRRRENRYEDYAASDRAGSGKRPKDRSPSPTARRKRKEAKAASRAKKTRELENDHSRALAELSMYTGADKPFHDANLGEQFVWKKKRDKERASGLSLEDIARKDALRRREAEEELAKLNKKRSEREAERALRDVEEARQARMAEDAQMKAWIDKEDDFQLEQARRRAGIRLREQRAKAIDFLAINLRFADARTVGRHTAAIGALTNPRKYEAEREEEEEGWGWADAGFEFEIDEPWRIFDNLDVEDCRELEQDIQMYLSFEKLPINIEFWDAMQIVCNHHLSDLSNPDQAAGGRYFNKDVDRAASKVVSGLSHARLVELENQTNAMLRSGQPVDGEFWDLVLKKIDLEKAIARLNAIHEVVLKNRLEQFKKRQRDDAVKATETASRIKMEEAAAAAAAEAEGVLPEQEDVDEDDWVEEYEPEMSPEPVDITQMTLDDRRSRVVDEMEHVRAIYAARHALVDSVRAKALSEMQRETPGNQHHTSRTVAQASAADLETERMIRAEAQYENDIESDQSENEFGDLDDALDLSTGKPQQLDYSDRYRPRKPRYFNRVHTGYEWNRYNQMHYDTENPPPKVVQGYKFNVFYPDLIDKSTAPTYRLQKDPSDPDTQIIVFTAGPPYEDIAFRIVRKPWEYSHRRGFRSTFDRGVLQLYFQFNKMNSFTMGC